MTNRHPGRRARMSARVLVGRNHAKTTLRTTHYVCLFIICAHFCMGIACLSPHGLFVPVSDDPPPRFHSPPAPISQERGEERLSSLYFSRPASRGRMREKPRSHHHKEPEAKVRETCRHSIFRLRHPLSALVSFLFSSRRDDSGTYPRSGPVSGHHRLGRANFAPYQNSNP